MNENHSWPVCFIIGVARTGSQMLRYILNEWSPVHISDEIHYLLPPWIGKEDAKTKIGTIRKKKNFSTNDLIDLFYSGAMYGNYWKDELPNIDKDLLKRLLDSCEILDDKCILRSLILSNALSNNKSIAGAKFPLNIMYSELLFEWFPEAKIIHLVRDPRAIYASMVKKDMKNKGIKSKMGAVHIYLYRFFYLIQQYKKAAQIHQKHKNDKNYLLVKFEDLILQPEDTLRVITKFLDVEFNKNMVNPPVIDSSYTNNKVKVGFDKNTLYKWRGAAPQIFFKLVEILLKKEMSIFNYQ